MDQIAEAIWTFGWEFLVLQTDVDHRLDQSVVSMVLSEPSEMRESSDRLTGKKRCGTVDDLNYIQLAISYFLEHFHDVCVLIFCIHICDLTKQSKTKLRMPHLAIQSGTHKQRHGHKRKMLVTK